MSRCRELYRAEQLPVFQNQTFDSLADAASCARGDVVLVQNENTGLIFNQAFHPDRLTYDSAYQNEQALSRAFRSHLDEVTAIVSHHFLGCSLIEIGCGKGYFLEHLSSLGFDITGFDPAYEGSNAKIRKCKFSSNLGLGGDALILRHVLEHIEDPVAFLMQLRDANDGRGRIYIEVPCLDWIAGRNAWFDIYYEHVNYFRLSDFSRMFGQIIDSGRIFGGQYLYVVADLATVRTPDGSCAPQFSFPGEFVRSITYYAEMIRSSYKSTSPARAVVWGAASKGVIFLLFMKRAGVTVDHVVDINPAKQGRYLPVIGQRVISPSEMLEQTPAGSTIFVMNSNYLNEIRSLTNCRFNYITVDHE